jgi:hypothetical protein
MNFPRLLMVCFLLGQSAFQVSGQVKVYETSKISGKAPSIDAIADDVAWQQVEWATRFTQREPNDGAPASQETRYKLLFDDNNLYLLVQALDSLPSGVVKRMSRRDTFDGDWIAVSIDSYADKQTAFTFGVSAAGVKFDFMLVNNNSNDLNWDAVFYTATRCDSSGWLAEMRIPLSQLRFSKSGDHQWGINVFRYIYRKQELSLWQAVSITAPGLVSFYGTLTGISGLKPKRDIELLPYTYLKASYEPQQKGNPFRTGQNYSTTAGLDGKIALTNDLTLNFTLNPDFGQVEADASVVNLTAFETFFTEKRPFFVEGRNIFNFKLTGVDNENNINMLFYSRRIGRTPHYVPAVDSGVYVKAPAVTPILGSFKISGKTRNGLSVGIIGSVTPLVQATIDSAGHYRKVSTEPVSSYLIARLSKDFNKGETVVGGIFTATNRYMASTHLNFLPEAAYTGGLHATHYWKNRTYYATLRLMGSSISGSTAAISALQLSPAHYFQKPDVDYVTYDPTLKRLSGYGFTAEVGKAGTGKWQMLGYITARSPGLDFNDAGYLKQADEIQQLYWMRYRKFKPFGIFHWAHANVTEYSTWNYGGDLLNKGIDLNAHAQFANYITAGAGINLAGTVLARGELWGGPSLKLPQLLTLTAYAESDSRKKLIVKLSGSYAAGNYSYYNIRKMALELTYRPTGALMFSVIPQYTSGYNNLQYISTISVNGGDRYIMSKLTRSVPELAFRANLGLTPELSVQYYAQPFLFGGQFSDYKVITNPGARDYAQRFACFDQKQIYYSAEYEAYLIDENKDGEVDYGFYKPDFHSLQFKSNLVLRWEYKTGSSLYLVWSQGKNVVAADGAMYPDAYLHELWNAETSNDLMLKVSWLINF